MGRRASEDQLSGLHGQVGAAIEELMKSDNPADRLEGIKLGIRFLKDNQITAMPEASTSIEEIKQALPTADELERLMHMTPD